MTVAEFLSQNHEDGDYNQYWYSEQTITKIVEALIENNGKIAFLSTPSLYFSLPDEIKSRAYVFDFDKKWEADRGFVFYDFKQPDVFPKELLGTFDMVVVDPPFITQAVWENYTITTKLLMKKGNDKDGSPSGKVILTTLQENAGFLKDLLGAKPTVFQPSIPNLVYQYSLYTNYDTSVFSSLNPEIA